MEQKKPYESPEAEVIKYRFEDMMASIKLSETETVETTGNDDDNDDVTPITPD